MGEKGNRLNFGIRISEFAFCVDSLNELREFHHYIEP
jgi:hypothetical protein